MEKGKLGDRFEIVYKESGGFSGPDLKILRDKVTGVQYLFAGDSYGAGLTPLLDGEGKPLR